MAISPPPTHSCRLLSLEWLAYFAHVLKSQLTHMSFWFQLLDLTLYHISLNRCVPYYWCARFRHKDLNLHCVHSQSSQVVYERRTLDAEHNKAHLPHIPRGFF